MLYMFSMFYEKRGGFYRSNSPCFAVKRGVKHKEKSMERG